MRLHKLKKEHHMSEKNGPMHNKYLRYPQGNVTNNWWCLLEVGNGRP